MFQYALGRHLALKNGTDLVVDTTYFDSVSKNNSYFVKRGYDLDFFNVDVKILEPKDADWLPYYNSGFTHRLRHFIKRRLNLYKYMNNCLIVRENEYFSFDKEILKCGNNAYLIGYWQNENYFKEIEAQIRRDFTFKDTLDEKVHALAKEMSNINSVCLNIRRGDFVHNPIHGFVGMEYISKAVDYMQRHLDVQKIYVFSDEIDWCIQNLRFNRPSLFVSHEYAGEKFSAYLYLMTQCRHFIIPNSTFGWWGAWLSENHEKTVIAPKRWVNAPGIDASDIIPSGWMTM